MDVKSYFPEGISLVQHDESKNEELTSFSEIVAAPVQFHNHRLMKKSRDPPLLPVILEVGSNPTETSNFDGPIHCYLCYRKISRNLNKFNYYKPCWCNLLYVHISCAFEEDNFIGNRCGSCGQMYQPPKEETKKNLAIINRQTGGKDSMEMMEEKKESTILDDFCMICENQRYKKPMLSEKYEAKFLRPCFCEVSAHHGCMVKYIENKSACEMCGVKYRHLTYGSVLDYFKRYYYQYLCYLIFFTIVSIFFIIAATHSTIFTGKTDWKNLILTVLALFFCLVAVGTFICLLKYTIMKRIPRFRARYGNVTIVPYDPNIQTKKAAKKSLNKARSNAAGDQVFHLNKIRSAGNRMNEEDYSETALTERQGFEDLTLGQFMFGVCPTYHTSSTPIENVDEKKQFIFESIKEEIVEK